MRKKSFALHSNRSRGAAPGMHGMAGRPTMDMLAHARNVCLGPFLLYEAARLTCIQSYEMEKVK